MMLYGTTVGFASPSGVRKELEEERKKHSESKEGAHAANPYYRHFRGQRTYVKHTVLTAF